MSQDLQASAPSATTGRRGLHVGRIFGIEIRLDVSVLVIFGLVVWSLATGAFPTWHPDWGPQWHWGVALVAGVLFFVSLLLHELAHSLVAKARGIPVPRITLFLFGGVSEMQREPDTPRTELLVALVGPLTSAVLGVAFVLLGTWLAGPGFADRLATDPEAALAALGPAETIALWLGPLNLMLAVFNMVPGFPLDGGRVLRSLLWWAGGDLVRATRHASVAGQIVGWALIAWGLLRLFAGAFLGGAWLALIGWFLLGAARSSYTQLVVREVLTDLRVADLMRTHFEVVPPDLDLDTFIEDRLLRAGQAAWPVVAGDHAVGLVTLDDVARVPEARRPHLRVRDVMRPLDDAMKPELGGEEALQQLLQSDHDPLPVVLGDDRIVGLLHRNDILRWLSLHQLRAEPHP